MLIRQAHLSDLETIAAMCELLWPDSPAAEHARELSGILETGRYGTLPAAILVAQQPDGSLVGFLQIGLRSHADGCDPAQPVGFIEGWFVGPASRGQSIGKALMSAAEGWSCEHGCKEMASDTWIDHDDSQQAHSAVGFEVVDRCVHFRKSL